VIIVSSLAIGLTVVFSGCEAEKIDTSSTTDSGTTQTDPASTNTASTNAAATNVVSTVLNDDPNCELVVKYQNRDVHNEGQVHYLKRVLTSDPFDSANPVCVQYNDTRSGEVTVWKDQSSRGPRVDVLPSDCGIDKVVVWYE